MRNSSVRVQSIVCRDGRVLMAKHQYQGREYWCLPGGALEGDESLEEGALRELKEECGVRGKIVRRTSQLFFGPQGEHQTFLVDIGSQEPALGSDPEVAHGQEILIDVGWLALSELTEKDRVFLWGAGLLGVDGFYELVASWADEISYPGARTSSEPAPTVLSF